MRRAARCLLLLLPLLLGGCLDYAEVLTLRADGSGRLEAEATLDLGLVRRLSLALGEEPDAGAFASPTRDELLAALSVDGVTVRALEVEPQGERTRLRVTLDFADLEALHRLEAFGARRRLELFDAGAERVLVVSSLDPREVIPLREEAEDWALRSGLSPQEASALEELVQELRRTVRLRSELRLPGPILASNGHSDSPSPAWAVDQGLYPGRHVTLGLREVLMKVLCERSTLPWARELAPVPAEVGSVTDDAITGVAEVTTSSSVAASARRGGGGAGCGLGARPRTVSPWAFGWLLVGCALLRLRARER